MMKEADKHTAASRAETVEEKAYRLDHIKDAAKKRLRIFVTAGDWNGVRDQASYIQRLEEQK